MSVSRRIAILQPEIPHYREEFFALLKERCEAVDLYVYNSARSSEGKGFHIGKNEQAYITNKQLGGFLFYNPAVLLKGKYDTLVLMWHFAHITTWLLLLTKFIHRKKIVLWGQGISVKRYLKEEKHPNILLKWMLALADGAWVYMEKEAIQWRKIFPKKLIVSLNNSISGAEDMVIYEPKSSKEELKLQYGIKEKIVLLFCARFTNPYRRVDLLVDVIEKMNKDMFGFVIIGEGCYKPDFSKYENVYDFGAVYDNVIKRDLFSLSDLYFQPGWVGLSIVEAMAYGKPICTFKRSEDVLQCVEYSYIGNGVNGMIFKSIDDCIEKLGAVSDEDIVLMGTNARRLVKDKLTINMMAENAISIL